MQEWSNWHDLLKPATALTLLAALLRLLHTGALSRSYHAVIRTIAAPLERDLCRETVTAICGHLQGSDHAETTWYRDVCAGGSDGP